MAPVPWPDGAAYYLPGIELVSTHPLWRMHNQAAFVPSYDQASFNIPPGLPFLFGVTDVIGVNELYGAQFGLRMVSIAGLLALGWLVFKLSERKLPGLLAAVLGLSAVLDPISRWGAMAVRTEIWVALAGAFLLMELERERKRFWLISLILAVAALFHYDAIILVPAAVIGLYPRVAEKPAREWFGSLLRVGVGTLVFLSPFILYTALHFSFFVEQMGTQFARLSHGNLSIGHRFFYDSFHALFLDAGNPSGPPKFFNIGKFIIWLTIFSASIVTLNHPKKFHASLTAGASFFSALYLWATKPEFWFVSLAHFMFWPFLAFAISDLLNHGYRRSGRILATLVAAFLGVAFISTIIQSRAILPYYSWKNLAHFENCIKRQIIHSQAPFRIWELGYPDVLVDLAQNDRSLDLTRSLDFPNKVDMALGQTSTYQMIIFNNFSDYPAELGAGIYEGPPRRSIFFDDQLLHNGRIPYGSFIWNYLNREDQKSQWKFKVCQSGPFWATLALRN